MSHPLRVLHAIHDFLPRHRAGSEIYAFELGRALARRHHVWVLCAECDPSRPHGMVTWRAHEGLPVVELVNNWAFPAFEDTYRSALINARLRAVLAAIQPDIVHIHNLLNLSMDLPALARAHGAPSVATLHDYTLLCPSGGQRVHVAESHVCTDIDTARCSRCFPQSPFHAQMAVGRLAPRRGLALAGAMARGVGRVAPRLVALMIEAARRAPGVPLRAADVDRRLEYARRVFDEVDLFAAPSAALGAEFERFGLPAAKIRVSDYGMPPLARRARRTPDGRFRIGFVGTLVWHKGPHVLLEAVGRLPADRVEVRLHGDPDAFPSYVRRLRRLARGLPVRFMGPFDTARTAEIYAGLDVLVVPSLWPENSPLVIHEAFLAGLPVVAARQGGVPELVTHGVNGLLYEATSSDELAAALGTLLEDPERLRRLADAATPVKTIESDARWWEARYEEVRAARRARPASTTLS